MKNKYSRTVIEIQESTDFLPIFETIDGVEMPYLPLPHKNYPLAKQLS
jgi:hypothetical protein